MSNNNATFHIVRAHTAEHFATAKALFTMYAKWLGVDLAFQGFETELSGLPGKYGAPDGELLLAFHATDWSPLGCVALRPLEYSNERQEEGRHCEMKRLFVAPEARGLGLGGALVNAIVQRAKDLGYQGIRLDTLPSMQGAIRLYRRLGFVETESYYNTPLEGTIFLALDLMKA